MLAYSERSYRKKTNIEDLVSFHMVIKETDLWISAERELEKEARDLAFDCRQQLETHIKTHSEFATALTPQHSDPFAPQIVQQMIDATRVIGVGPMAAVAGAIAEYVANGLLQSSAQIIVENGGDIFLNTRRPATISIFAGPSPLSEKIGLEIPVRQMPLGVCSSSGTVGHSLSLGIADVCCILSPSAALADGVATAFGNRVKRKEDLGTVAEWADQVDGIIGGVVVVDDRFAAWGDIELVDLSSG